MKEIVFQRENWGDPADWPAEWIHVEYDSFPRYAPIIAARVYPSTVNEASRRSSRTRTAQLTGDALLDLLTGSFAVQEVEGTEHASRRSYPSAGARFPTEIYVRARGISGLENGLYHYSQPVRCLRRVPEGDEEAFAGAFGHDWIIEAQACIFFASKLERSGVKYGARAFRFACIEAGHAAQNVQLVAAELSLATCPVGGFCDALLEEYLNLDESGEVPLYTVILP